MKVKCQMEWLTALEKFLEHHLNLPFILVSGTVGEETAVESLRAGATDYVLKDRLSRLGPVVKRALRERDEQIQRQQAEQALHQSLQEIAHTQRFLLALSQAAQAVQRAHTPLEIYDTIGREVIELGYHLFNTYLKMHQKCINGVPNHVYRRENASVRANAAKNWYSI